jgi:hypothetical protein
MVGQAGQAGMPWTVGPGQAGRGRTRWKAWDGFHSPHNPATPGPLLAADEGADGGVVDGADVRGVSRPRRRGAGGAWSLGWRVGRQGGGGVVIRR